MSLHLARPDIERLVSKRDIKGLVVALEDGDESTRWMAVGGLGELRDPRAVAPLVRALSDADPEVKWKAVEALGYIGDSRATGALISLLSDSDGTAQLQAIWALGRIQDRRATKHLIPFLTGSDYDAKIAAIWALGAIGDKRAIPVLLNMLLDRHSGVRSKVAEALEMCKWEPLDIRERGALAFARRDWETVARYSRALIDILIWALDDNYFVIRMHSARILGKTRSRHAVDPLRRVLDDSEGCVTYEAAAALAEIGSKESRQALVHGLESPHLGTRKVAAGALERLGWEPGNLYHKILFMSAKDDWIGLIRLKKHGVASLTREFIERHGSERADIAKALRVIGNLATEAMIGLLKHPDPDIRWRAASVLGDTKDKRAVGPLIVTLRDADESVSSSAATALGELRDKKAVNPLIRACKEGSPDLRRHSVAALGKIGSRQAITTIVEASRDESLDVRLSAVWAMGMIGDASVVSALAPLTQDPDPAIRLEAIRALRKYPGLKTGHIIIRSLQDPDAKIRWESAQQAGRFRMRNAIRSLIRLFGDPDAEVKEAAVKALERIGWMPADRNEQLAYLIAKGEWKKIQRLELLPDPLIKQKSSRPVLLPGGFKSEAQALSQEGQSLQKLPKASGEEYSQKKENETGHEGVPALQYFVRMLINPVADVQARVKAAEALGNLGDLRGVQPLVRALQDSDAEIRGSAALSLGILGDRKASRSLVIALNDPVFEVRQRAAEALSAIGSQEAIHPLIKMIEDPDPGNRALAVTTLGDFENDNAIRALLISLNDPRPGVRSAAIDSLLKLIGYWGSRVPVFLKDTDPVVRANVVTALKSILGDDETISRLHPLLKAGNFTVRKETALALRKMGWSPNSPEEHAILLISDRKWDEVVLLGKHAEIPLIDALFDIDQDIRDGAIDTLRRSGNSETAHAIRAAMKASGDLQIKGIYAAMKAARLIENEIESDSEEPTA